jgi:CO/xanthine dehydrogenase FAD-binding subunit
MAARRTSADALIDVTGLAELAGIAGDAKYLSIGAATRLAELEESQIVADQAPLLAETVGRVAAPSVRRLATLLASFSPPA